MSHDNLLVVLVLHVLVLGLVIASKRDRWRLVADLTVAAAAMVLSVATELA